MDIYDVVALVGLALLAVGLWFVAPWVSLTVVGALLILFGLFGARSAARGDVTDARGGS